MNTNQIPDDVREKIEEKSQSEFEKWAYEGLELPQIEGLKSENEILKAYVSELEKQQAFPEDISNAIIKQFAYSGDVHYSIIEAMENRIAGAEWLWAEICSSEISRLKSELQSAQEEIQKLKSNKWISVSDRLPNPGQNVLVYRKGYFHPFDVAEYSKVFAMEFIANAICITDHVTHWQPLPEPPETKIIQVNSVYDSPGCPFDEILL